MLGRDLLTWFFWKNIFWKVISVYMVLEFGHRTVLFCSQCSTKGYEIFPAPSTLVYALVLTTVANVWQRGNKSIKEFFAGWVHWSELFLPVIRMETYLTAQDTWLSLLWVLEQH